MCLSFRSIKDKEVKVNKPHRCEWGAHSIPKGDKARLRVYVFDREMVTGWMHLDCYAAMNESAHDIVCEGWMAGDFERGEIAA